MRENDDCGDPRAADRLAVGGSVEFFAFRAKMR
jgi:hypothetical protein